MPMSLFVMYVLIKHEQLNGYVNTQTVISLHCISIFMSWGYVGLLENLTLVINSKDNKTLYKGWI